MGYGVQENNHHGELILADDGSIEIGQGSK